jgi:hypothetical protein
MRGLQGIQGERGGLREGFYGTIIFKNEMNIDYSYNYNLKYKNLPVTTGTFTNALQSINYTIGEDSNDRLLRPYYEYNVEYFRNSVSIQYIEFSISGGKYRRPDNSNIFYFTPNNNCINEGTLILRSIVPTGWYGNFTVYNYSDVGNLGRYLDYKLFDGNTPLTNNIRVNVNSYTTFLIPLASRLLNQSSRLKFELVAVESNYQIINTSIGNNTLGQISATIFDGALTSIAELSPALSSFNDVIVINFTINYIAPPPPPQS